MTNDQARIDILIADYKLIHRCADGSAVPEWTGPRGVAPRVALAEIAALFGIKDPAALGNALAAGGYRLSRDRSKVNLSTYRWRQMPADAARRRAAAQATAARARVAAAWLSELGTAPVSAAQVFRCEPVMRELDEASGGRPSTPRQLSRWIGEQSGLPAGGYMFAFRSWDPRTYSVRAVPPAEQFAHLA